MSDDTGSLVLTPPARNYSSWYQWMTRLAATTHEDPLPEGEPAEFGAWMERRRARLAELLGPEPEAVPLNLETLESVACDGYRRDKVVFDTEDTMSVPAYLLVPDGRQDQAPGAAVLACHGHGPGKGQVVGLEHTNMPNADYGLQLARRGYVVLVPDLRCFGERLDWNPEDHYACDTNLVHAAMAGWNPLAQNIWDLRRSLDVLAQHPLVDPERLGMVGISYGGTVTLFTAAVDTRVAASVVSGYFSSWAVSHKMPWNMCGSQIMFGMLGRLEHEDLGALVAPAPAPRRVRDRGRPVPLRHGHRVGAPDAPRLRGAGCRRPPGARRLRGRSPVARHRGAALPGPLAGPPPGLTPAPSVGERVRSPRSAQPAGPSAASRRSAACRSTSSREAWVSGPVGSPVSPPSRTPPSLAIPPGPCLRALGISLRRTLAGRLDGRLGGLVGAVVTGAMQPTPPPHPALLPPAAHYRRATTRRLAGRWRTPPPGRRSRARPGRPGRRRGGPWARS